MLDIRDVTTNGPINYLRNLSEVEDILYFSTAFQKISHFESSLSGSSMYVSSKIMHNFFY